jgi:broad specificity phosphatase PhoE
MPDAPRIWLMRHGESEWNALGRWQGHGDPPLSKRGRRDAERVAGDVAARVTSRGRPLRLYCSDLRRALETAVLVGAALGLEPSPLATLRELDVGDWVGLTRAEIESRDPDRLTAFEAEDPDLRPGGGETRREIRSRVRGAVDALTSENPEADLLLVVHLGVIRALMPGTEPENLELLAMDLPSIGENAASTESPRPSPSPGGAGRPRR